MGSQATAIPRFGRMWSVAVSTPREWINLSDSTKEDEGQLRVTFDIWEPANYGALWYGDISVYNLDRNTQDKVLGSVHEGAEVIVNAGYETGQYGEIFRGRVFQPMWDRENVVDFRTTLRCVVGLEFLAQGWVNTVMKAGSSQADIIRQMARSVTTPVPVQVNLDLDESLEDKKLERGRVLFGSPRDIVDQIARDNVMQWWYDGDTLHVRRIFDDSSWNAGLQERYRQLAEDQIRSQAANKTGRTFVYSPETGIVGTPQLSEQGANFRVFLDPRIHVDFPPMQVKLEGLIRQYPNTIGGGMPSIFAKDNTYIVAGVRHIGDSRGNEWYTEVIGFTNSYAKLNFLTGVKDTPGAPQDPNHR